MEHKQKQKTLFSVLITLFMSILAVALIAGLTSSSTVIAQMIGFAVSLAIFIACVIFALYQLRMYQTSAQ